MERNAWVGGNAGSFDLGGIRVDFGSHRLHPSCDPEVLGDIRTLIGDDLLRRPRHGRIRLRGRWIHFPLKPIDLALRLPPEFVMGVARDTLSKVLTRNFLPVEEETFASVLEKGLGRTICRDFYFPYAKKLWGLEPDELSATQARRRVSANSLARLVGKALSAVPGLNSRPSGYYYYPRLGYGQISEAYCRAAGQAGADIRLTSQVEAVEIRDHAAHSVVYSRNGQTSSLQADHVWSTIPVTYLARCLQPAPPAEYLLAAERIGYRSMILVYLILELDRFSEFDAHYFPGLDSPVSRLSEPKNYSRGEGPPGLTVLCAEIPCSVEDEVWQLEDEALGELVKSVLDNAGVPLRVSPQQVLSRRLSHAYPIYRRGYESSFSLLDEWISQIKGLLSFGRQGLFAHDNTHHTLYMAYAAVSCLDQNGGFNIEKWLEFRQEFESHVVED